MPSSKLKTLPEYLNAMRPLIFDIVMAIPPIDPSGGLRTSLLLRLTSDLLDAIPAYHAFVSTLPEDTEDELMSTSGGSAGSEIGDGPRRYPLVELFEMLSDLDGAWVAVLSCQVWNNEIRSGEDVVISLPEKTTADTNMDGNDDPTQGNIADEVKLYAPSATDCTRLRCMLVSGMSAIEDWLDEAHAPEAAMQPFEDCFEWTLRLLGDDSNQTTWIDDGFVSCEASDP